QASDQSRHRRKFRSSKQEAGKEKLVVRQEEREQSDCQQSRPGDSKRYVPKGLHQRRPVDEGRFLHLDRDRAEVQDEVPDRERKSKDSIDQYHSAQIVQKAE